MKTYWDLSEIERAALTADDVQRYLDAELMLKGVLKAKPPIVAAVPCAPKPTTKVFMVSFAAAYGRKDADVAFTTLEDAQSFLALRPVLLDSDWLETSSVEYTRDAKDPRISEVCVFTEEAKNAAAAELKRAAAIVAANAKRKEVYDVAVREQTKALAGLWEDWNECREKEALLRAVVDTYEQYLQMAGNDEVAARFLAKAYPSPLIDEAASRFDLPRMRATAESKE